MKTIYIVKRTVPFGCATSCNVSFETAEQARNYASDKNKQRSKEEKKRIVYVVISKTI